MIDQEQQRDHEEEAAVRAEQDAEHASEQQHEQRQRALVIALRDLAREAQSDGAETLAALAEAHRLGEPLNSHRYELFARQTHTHAIARLAARGVEGTGSYDLLGVARAFTGAYRSTHVGPGGFVSVAGAADAAQRVLDTVREVLAR